MSLPQLLNYLRFLRWRRSSSKTKACNFLGIRSLHALCQKIFFHLFRKLLWRPSFAAASSTFNSKVFRAFRQIDAFPILNPVVTIYIKSPCCLAVA